MNWVLSWYLVSSCLVGRDASGHVAEEAVSTKKAAAKGVFWATGASALCGFPISISIIFCMSPIETFYDNNVPRPFINMYAMALGPYAHVVMTLGAIIGATGATNCSSWGVDLQSDTDRLGARLFLWQAALDSRCPWGIREVVFVMNRPLHHPLPFQNASGDWTYFMKPSRRGSEC
ncbi:hypothetical protein PENVUL_c020G10341 [Penicillium vulpinum]|uniref:Uncharacterized protein n=1 Tax=Penicillium vulpinum TaxID=29845 RepID=A0A1V6RWV0_9EURO|nr:hypothetical protein PENVUL_c020G10341 [Penicillium vulpinum]